MINIKKINAFLLGATILLSACNNAGDQNAEQRDTTTSAAQASNSKPVKTVLIFGDSLTAGYGLDDPATEAYPSVLQDKIKAAKLPYKVINAGNSGETTAGGLGRIDWVLRQKVDIFVLELGANDGLRGVPVSETAANLQKIIDRVKAKYPDAKLVMAGMQVPPSMGADYANDFKAVFPTLATKNNMVLVPFLLDHVGGVAKLNQADGIHPTKKGAKIVAENVWRVLKGIL
ncbi:arylesterase [Mucilaginibacter daejeonensis]|uniref:arylesterase n=1 Tax=Mucilaginibacter daejeonensis TaxID=398049 RepID=UPI001D17AA2F|nr:arylesterase [Mucilaginibacter daejeonensis]UEG51580.1 arylesterase [Mucilaginibacter daejeonensis]